jgi:hypothetical protein
MVKIHGEERKMVVAVGTRHVPQPLQQCRLIAPKSTRDDWWATSFNTQTPTFESPHMGACTMAVRADDFALFELCDQPVVRNAAGSLKQPEFLGAAPGVIEVHHMGRKLITAISAGDGPQPPKELHCLLLAPPNPHELFIAVGLVVSHVVGALIAPALHTCS